MIRRLFRKMFRLVIVLGAAAAVYKVVQARRPSPELPGGDAWPPTPKPKPGPSPAPIPVSPPPKPARAEPAAAKPASAKPAAAKPAANDNVPWVEPVDGGCPPSHPVKAKLTSGIYHLPGMAAYERTNPDRCYRDEKSAQVDGLRKAKR